MLSHDFIILFFFFFFFFLKKKKRRPPVRFTNSFPANRVIGSMRAQYHIATNNCQRFCQGLIDCILIPNTGREILHRESELPSDSRTQIVYYRFWDYFLAQLAVKEDDKIPQPLPFSAQDLSSFVIDVLSLSTIISYWHEREKIRFIMLLMTFWLCAWSSNLGIFRHLLREPAWLMTNERAWRELERVAFPKWVERHRFQ